MPRAAYRPSVGEFVEDALQRYDAMNAIIRGELEGAGIGPAPEALRKQAEEAVRSPEAAASHLTRWDEPELPIQDRLWRNGVAAELHAAWMKVRPKNRSAAAWEKLVQTSIRSNGEEATVRAVMLLAAVGAARPDLDPVKPP